MNQDMAHQQGIRTVDITQQETQTEQQQHLREETELMLYAQQEQQQENLPQQEEQRQLLHQGQQTATQNRYLWSQVETHQTQEIRV